MDLEFSYSTHIKPDNKAIGSYQQPIMCTLPFHAEEHAKGVNPCPSFLKSAVAVPIPVKVLPAGSKLLASLPAALPKPPAPEPVPPVRSKGVYCSSSFVTSKVSNHAHVQCEGVDSLRALDRARTSAGNIEKTRPSAKTAFGG